MTPEELDKLTPEQKRVKIAEACPENMRCVRTPNLSIWQVRGSLSSDEWSDCLGNDPLRDLNAMHEAEKTLSEKQELFYMMRLMEVMKLDGTIGTRADRTFKATASQRADAFLLMICAAS